MADYAGHSSSFDSAGYYENGWSNLALVDELMPFSGGEPPDVSIPDLVDVFPTALSQVDFDTPIEFTSRDLQGLGVELVFIVQRGIAELVWDGASFTGTYASSIRTEITPEKEYDWAVIRTPGWVTPPNVVAKLWNKSGLVRVASWIYTLAEELPPAFGQNTNPVNIEWAVGDIYDAMFQNVGDGLQSHPGSIVEAWRFARAEGVHTYVRDARAFLQFSPNTATDHIPRFESILGFNLDPELTTEQKQEVLSRRYTRVADATGPTLEDELKEIDPAFELYTVPFEYTSTTDLGVRAFEDWDPDDALSSGPRFDPNSGRTFTAIPNYGSSFKVHVFLNTGGGEVDDTKKRAIIQAETLLAEMLPAWTDFVIFQAGGFYLDTDLLDLTVFTDGLTLP